MHSDEGPDFLMHKVCRAHHGRIAQVMDQLGLHRGQPPILFMLSHRDGQTNSELARHLDVSAANITNIVKRMEQAGFVQRRRGKRDERLSRVYLTDAGRAIFDEVKTLSREVNDVMFSGFSAVEREKLHALLLRLYQNLQ